MPSSASKIVVFNARYSTNLGDGVIAECLEDIIGRSPKPVECLTLDVGGRTGFGQAGLLKQSTIGNLARQVYRALPKPMALAIANLTTRRIMKTRIVIEWEEKARDADLIVIGGGQLIADADDYFPQRIAAICELAEQYNIPYLVHAVGVSQPSDFTRKNKERLSKYFRRSPLFLGGSVREKRSLAYWKDLFGQADLSVQHDPAFLADEVYKVGKIRNKSATLEAKPRVGVGVMCGKTAALHSSDKATRLPVPSNADFFRAVAMNLLGKGYAVKFFTNGAPEDEATLTELKACDFGQFSEDIDYAERPLKPVELVETISTFDVVLAHRLHALIVAHSIGMPTVSMMWDEKIDAFSKVVGREDYLACGNLSPEEIGELADKALKDGFDAEKLRDIKLEVAKSCDMLIAAAS